jgi:hypothetical protein
MSALYLPWRGNITFLELGDAVTSVTAGDDIKEKYRCLVY